MIRNYQFFAILRHVSSLLTISTSGYPWSNPIRLNNFSYELSLIGIFLDGLPGTIVLPQDNLYLPPDHSWDGPFGGSQDG